MRIRHLIHFFAGEFHTGSVNIGLHFVGFTIMGYAIAQTDLRLLILSALVMESGHVYNYVTGRVKIYPPALVPIQLIAFGLFYLLMGYIFKLI